jgi:FG-GAP-like repeat
MLRLRVCLFALLAGAALFHAAPAAADVGVSVAVGDLNGDGLDDIVNIDAVGAINVILCNPDGSFSMTTYTPGDLSAPSSVAVADVNGDGWPDVIVTDASDATTGVHVLFNNGDGTLATAVVYPSGEDGTPGPQAVVVADANGDGLPDIVTANGTADAVSILPNAGGGAFGAPQQYPTGTSAVAIAAADVNGDGWQDIVTTNLGDDSVAVLLNNGDGTFAAPVEQTVGSGPVSVSLVDVNGDGHPDAVVANQNDNTASVLLGNGDGTFAAPKSYPTGLRPSWITAQDLNGDGLPEIVTDNYNDGSVSLFANNGDGTFAPQQQIYPNYGSDNTVVMRVNRSRSPAVVSVDLQVSSVVVTATPAIKGKSVKNQPKPGVYRVSGAKVSSDSGHGGTFDGMSLLLLGAFLARRRLFRAA